jgi:hypothetical protein
LAEVKLIADSGGGTVALKAPASTNSNQALVLKLPVADGSNGQALTTSGSGQLSFTTISSTPTTTRGDIIFRGASADVRLAKGSNGQYLQMGANDPSWVTLSTGISSDAERNTNAGTNAGDSFTGTDATDNTNYGYDAGTAITTGDYNTCLGSYAGATNSTSSYNTAIGWKAWNAGTGAACTMVGAEAGLSTTSNSNDTYIGSSAGRYATGEKNVAIGSEAFEGVSGSTSGSENVFIGHQAGHAMTSGSKNTFIGHKAGYSQTSHSNTIAIGCQASENIVTGGSIAIGSKAGHDHTTCHTNICIGDNTDSDSGNNSGGHTATLIGHNTKRSGGTYNEGAIGNSATGLGSNKLLLAWSNVYHNGNNADFSTTSDQRIKKNIVNNNTGLSVINNIQVKNFEYKTKEEVKEAFPSFTATQVDSAVVEKSGTQLGLIAQELATVLPHCVSENDFGVKSVERDELFWYMLNAIKELSAKVETLEKA